MSDTPSAFPRPPPAGIPPPVSNQVASPVPSYPPTPVAGPPVGYPQGWQQQMWQQQAPPQPGVGAGWGVVGILAQFEPPALWAIIAGLITVVAPSFIRCRTVRQPSAPATRHRPARTVSVSPATTPPRPR